MPLFARRVQQQHPLPLALPEVAGDDCDGEPDPQHPSGLFIISENDYIHSLIPSATQRAKPPPNHHTAPPLRIGTPSTPFRAARPSRPLMTTFAYSAHAAMAAPGSPPDLTNSKSSKSSSFHSASLPDIMGHSDLAHFEDINLDDVQTGPSSFRIPPSPSHRVLFDARPSAASARSAPHSSGLPFRDLTAGSKPRYPSLKGHVKSAVRSQLQLGPPGKPLRRGFTSPASPSAPHTSLTTPGRRPRSPSPSNAQGAPSTSRSLSRSSSRKLSPAPSFAGRRQSWQHMARKTAKEREAECDDEDDELPDDAIMWNVPMSPRPAQERSPAPSASNTPPQSTTNSPPNSRPGSLRRDSSTKPSPVLHSRHFSPGPLSPNTANKENFAPMPGPIKRGSTWEETYTTLDVDAKKVTEALEEYQTELESQQELKRQQPSLSRSSSIEQTEPKAKATTLPPLRKSDPLIDPLQPSMEKQKYLSRTRPSWLPPKNPKEEKKHLKEYQKMLARIEQAERLEAQRQETEAAAREQAERVKAEYWTNLLLPNWDAEMSNPEHKGTHRKMWWNGIPNKLRGTVWKRAIGNDLEISENTYRIALEKANHQIKELGDAAFDGNAQVIKDTTKAVFPSLNMFSPASTSTNEHNEPTTIEAQPLHHDLVNVCLAYASYRSDVDASPSTPHIAALLLLNMPAPDAFTTLCNVLNRALPLSFLVRDAPAMANAFASTLHALDTKCARLAARLAALRVEPRDFLDDMFASLFCSRLSFDLAARVMDVYAIESDKIPPRVAVAIMCIVEGSCVEGDATQVARMLREKEIEMDVEEFMARVYEAGKADKR